MTMNAKNRKGKKTVWIVLGVIVGLIIVVIGCGVLFTEPGRKEIMDLPIKNMSFLNLTDGTYVGKYIGTKDHMRDTTVQVTVKGGEVSDIQPDSSLPGLVKDGKPIEIRKGQTIFDLYSRVIDAQSLQVDVISGATLTSKTHLKAVENAVEQAQKK